MEELNKILEKDCKEGMKDLPEESISLCITDPPYNYDIIGQKWEEKETRRRLERVKEEGNKKWVEGWGKELYRVMKPGGLVFVFNSTRTVAHIQVSLEEVGFYARDIIVWRRNSGIPKGLNLAEKLKNRKRKVMRNGKGGVVV